MTYFLKMLASGDSETVLIFAQHVDKGCKGWATNGDRIFRKKQGAKFSGS